MFNLKKKGVSEVVANILIVLLVIVGIAVIWSVVKPTIDKGAAGIQSDCFTVQVEALSCIETTTSGTYDVIVKRNPGAGSFDKIQLLFEEGTNSVLVDSGIDSLGELTTNSKTVTIPSNAGVTQPDTVNTILSINGNLCQVTAQPVSCT